MQSQQQIGHCSFWSIVRKVYKLYSGTLDFCRATAAAVYQFTAFSLHHQHLPQKQGSPELPIRVLQVQRISKALRIFLSSKFNNPKGQSFLCGVSKEILEYSPIYYFGEEIHPIKPILIVSNWIQMQCSKPTRLDTKPPVISVNLFTNITLVGLMSSVNHQQQRLWTDGYAGVQSAPRHPSSNNHLIDSIQHLK